MAGSCPNDLPAASRLVASSSYRARDGSGAPFLIPALISKIATVALPVSSARAFRAIEGEELMSPTTIPGNEPDDGDMSTEPGTDVPSGRPGKHDLPDDAAGKVGDFA